MGTLPYLFDISTSLIFTCLLDMQNRQIRPKCFTVTIIYWESPFRIMRITKKPKKPKVNSKLKQSDALQ